ncbi:hypothetical protein H6P81_007668 [Aristolochia fimbriata]|uniref:Pre-rRNA-processing protein Ipi1 N-terminal domain-containing protein n=1 Tax=Aristolochia fimbriata TaxID=158543 RepID=A0AAV7F274_ARIFI|nr:hypothetical protein H6P81_007668 [Aristolochia fimbriata]
MVRPKNNSKKKQKSSVDFKKIKRKIGRKLPPPKNTTDTTVKSKAIIIPEQTVASDKAGLAVSSKGLTLKELLQQTSHHNAKVRKDALNGIKDLVLKFPSELQSHKVAIIEKLRERIGDDDKSVRETLYQLLKTVVFQRLKDIPGPIISLLMAYVFNAMTHLAMDIRLMAFKFFDLIVQHYPSSFYLYAEKVLHNYEEILRNSQIYFQDNSKLKLALTGLVRCLSLLMSDKRKVDTSCDQGATLHAFEQEASKVHTGNHSTIKKIEELLPTLVLCFMEFAPSVRAMPVAEVHSFDCMLHTLDCINLAVRVCTLGQEEAEHDGAFFSQTGPHYVPGVNIHTIILLLKKLFEIFPLNPVHKTTDKDECRYVALNIGITEIFLYLNELVQFPMVLVEKFLQFMQNFLLEQIYNNKRSNKAVFEKHFSSLIPFMPKIISKVDFSWKPHLLEAFTKAFQGCKPESALTLTCLSAMEEMLLPKQMQDPWILESSPELLDYQLAWVRELSKLLLQLGDKHPLTSKAVLHLQHRLGQCIRVNSPLAHEYDNMQLPLKKIYCSCTDEGKPMYGPFIKLTRDCQELAVCCLYYFSSLDSLLLKSVAFCCLSPDLDPYMLFRIVEVVHSAYKAGHVQISDHISFLITLLARFKVITGEVSSISNRGTYKALVNAACSCFSQMGDGYLVLEILKKTTFSLLVPFQVPSYMHLQLPLDNMRSILRLMVLLSPEPKRFLEESIGILSYSLTGYLIGVASFLANKKSAGNSHGLQIFQYYMQPAVILLHRSKRLTSLVLELLGSSMLESNSSSLPERGIQSSLQQLSRIHAVASFIKFIYEDVKLHQSLYSCRILIKRILQIILKFQVSNEGTLNLEDKHKLQCAFDQLKTQTDTLHKWDATDFQGLPEVR